MYTFLRLWRAWLAEQGTAVTDDLTDAYSVLFTNSFMVPEKRIRAARKRHPKLITVQRVDGSAQNYGRGTESDVKQARINTLADLTIFQSEYSKLSTRSLYKVIPQDGPIIYNPVDLETFTPHGETIELPGDIRVCNASFSLNRYKGTWQIGALAAQNPDVTFILCGRYPDDLPDLPNIHQMGVLEHEALAAVMRSCHVFLQLAEREACPNVVTEALASGLPVLYVESGGNPELVREAGLPVTVESFPAQLAVLMAHHGELARMARHRAETHYAPDHIFGQYMAAIQAAERQPGPSLPRRILWRLQGYPVINERAWLHRVTGGTE